MSYTKSLLASPMIPTSPHTLLYPTPPVHLASDNRLVRSHNYADIIKQCRASGQLDLAEYNLGRGWGKVLFINIRK